MPKCPACGEEISNLTHGEVGARLSLFMLEGDGRVSEEEKAYISWREEFHCPECGIVLFNAREDAIRFLNGEDVPYIHTSFSLEG